MNWNYPFGLYEYIFVALFILGYTTYFIRTIRIAKRLKTPTRSLFIKFFMRSIYFSLLLVSLAGPFLGKIEQNMQAQGKDIYFLVDLSRSMDATDVAPSRLEKVKFEINKIITGGSGAERFGIIVFSNQAYVHSPLTYDRKALNLFVQAMQTDLLPGGGSDLCTALELAYDKVITDGASHQSSKILVMFTDGETDHSCKNSLLNNIRKIGIRVMIVGVGTPNGSSIKTNGQPLKDTEGQLVISKLDRSGLQKLSEQNNGTYFEINNQLNEVSRLTTEINAVTGLLVDTRVISVVNNRYYYFLGIALLLMVFDVLITIRTFRL